ncbi:MAG: exodeoxyribonuclease VII small subunit [Gemmatimonadota bacterium]|nr:exodeoxyribonuclease VII small subunit [Gemmatimonadota bacterium]
MKSELGLDARLRRIEEIVAALDSDALDLDEALAAFEEGVEHLARAREMLARTELRIEELIGPEGDEVRDLRLPGEDEPEGRADD